MARRLYSYYRSSAAFRVRIALNIKQLDYDIIPINLKPGEDGQHRADYVARNPEARVPFLEDGDVSLSQSMAIIEYLEESYPDNPILPQDRVARAEVRSLANLIAADIHPLNNLAVLRHIKAEYNQPDEALDKWYGHWIKRGFTAYEKRLSDLSEFSYGAQPTLADICLIPQVWNARRYKVDLTPFPLITAIAKRANQLKAFQDAAPENQPDTPTE